MKRFPLYVVSLVGCLLIGAIAGVAVTARMCESDAKQQVINRLAFQLTQNVAAHKALREGKLAEVKRDVEQAIGADLLSVMEATDWEIGSRHLKEFPGIKIAAEYCDLQKFQIRPKELDKLFTEAIKNIREPKN